MTGLFESSGGGDWDEELAGDLVGSTLLVGLTYLDGEQRLLGRRQVFGRVVSCDPEDGIVIDAPGLDEAFVMAPMLEAVEVGEPGEYQLADEEAVVVDPDFVALLTVTRPSMA